MSDDINASMQRERLAEAAAKSHKLGPTPGGMTNESRTNLHEQLRNTSAQPAAKSEQKQLTEREATLLLLQWVGDGRLSEKPNRLAWLYTQASGGERTLVELWRSIQAEQREAAAKSEQSDTPARQLGEPIWCAACGKMGDHGSGSCPTISHDYAELLPMMNAARMRMESALAAAKAEKETALGVLNDSLQSGRGQNIADVAVNVVNELCAAKAENAELRKRPTMEEVEAWQQFYGERCGGVPLRDPVFGLESFIEQQRRKEG